MSDEPDNVIRFPGPASRYSDKPQPRRRKREAPQQFPAPIPPGLSPFASPEFLFRNPTRCTFPGCQHLATHARRSTAEGPADVFRCNAHRGK
jgi:hypothetical protein